MGIEIAKKFGIAHGFNIVYFFTKWRHNKVFVCENSHEITSIGYPTFIIVEGSDPRFASSEETLNILKINPIVDKNYSGETLH